MNRRIAIFYIFCISSTAIANDRYPTEGIVYNTVEVSSLEYHCSEPKNGKIVCNFIQSAVRKKLNSAELPALIEKDKIEFKNNPLKKKDCEEVSQLKEMLEGKRPMPDPTKYNRSSELEKAETKKSVNALEILCKENTLDNYLAVKNIKHTKNLKTCKVSSNSFEQTFKLVAPSGGEKLSWVTESQPTGPCGLVQLSRFESEATKIGNHTYIDWNYVARKAVTNPSAELYMGIKCSGLDQGEYFYDWKPEERQMSCDYIEFSPI